MPKNAESLNNSLFELLRSRGYNPTLLGTDGKEIPVPDEAEVFQFHFIKDDEDYGPVTISIDGLHKLVIYFNDDIAKSPSDGDTSWYTLLNHLKRFSQQHQLSFEVKNTDHLKYDMAKRNHMKKVDEGRMIKGAGGVPLDRQGNEIPPKEVAPKMARVAKPKMDYDKIWFDVTNIISNIFPDGDPADYLPKYCRKHGLTYDDIRKAARKNGYKDEYEYIDQMKTGDYGYEEPVREAAKWRSHPDAQDDTSMELYPNLTPKGDKKTDLLQRPMGWAEKGKLTPDSVKGQKQRLKYNIGKHGKSSVPEQVAEGSGPKEKQKTPFVPMDKRVAVGKEKMKQFRQDEKDKEAQKIGKKKVEEGYYATGRKSSYSDNVPQVKIILQHSRQLEEGERRYRAIDRIFVENAAGERFLLDTKKPGLARVYARHIAEGGTPYDEQGKHIHSLVEEYTKMAGFVRATRNGQFNESTQSLVNEGVNHYNNLREQLHKMSGHRGYTAYFESWAPTLTEDEDTTDLSEMFASNELDPRIESVMPILRKLNKTISEMSETSELESWADDLIEESLGMGVNEGPKSDFRNTVERQQLAQLDQIQNSNKPAHVKEYLMAINDPAGPVFKAAYRSFPKGEAAREMLRNQIAQKYNIDPDSLRFTEHEGLADRAAEILNAQNSGLGEGDGLEALNSQGIPEEVEEDISPEQKRVGQLGPKDKVGKKGAVGKLVGACESVDQLDERDDREDDEHGGGPTPWENPDKGWVPPKEKPVKEGQKYPDNSNSGATRSIVVPNLKDYKSNKIPWKGITKATRVDPTITPTTVKKVGAPAPEAPAFLKKPVKEGDQGLDAIKRLLGK